ncbi:MAG TPA: hypothetical protein DCZ93_00030 [Elusimicrobia bacterium]|nr:hypothetical protein [Elusimicrobiota bacterium]
MQEQGHYVPDQFAHFRGRIITDNCRQLIKELAANNPAEFPPWFVTRDYPIIVRRSIGFGAALLCQREELPKRRKLFFLAAATEGLRHMG